MGVAAVSSARRGLCRPWAVHAARREVRRLRAAVTRTSANASARCGCSAACGSARSQACLASNCTPPKTPAASRFLASRRWVPQPCHLPSQRWLPPVRHVWGILESQLCGSLTVPCVAAVWCCAGAQEDEELAVPAVHRRDGVARSRPCSLATVTRLYSIGSASREPMVVWRKHRST